MITIHSKFVKIVEARLISKGYIIVDREVDIKDIIINETYIRVDLIVEKDGILIPVECGTVRPPRQERMSKLKQKFGSVLHIPYGYDKRKLLELEYNLIRNSEITKTVDNNIQECDLNATALIKITTDPKHRIVIPSNVWKYLELKPGDYITVDIKKEPTE